MGEQTKILEWPRLKGITSDEGPPAGKEAQLAIAGAAAVLTTLMICLSIYPLLSASKLLFSRIVIATLAVELTTLAILRSRQTRRTIRSFFLATAHPVSLAVFRIVVFWRIFREVELASIIPYTHIPVGLEVPPWGMGAVLSSLPINERWATICVVAVLVFSITGLIGLFARFSALACAVLGLYVLGIPQFFGKVDHYHHLLWFAAILAVSPCADFLAIDAVWQARRRADVGTTAPPPDSRCYALPLRFATILLGLIYFFPGFWKLWESGFDWVLGDNLKYQLYQFWTWSYDSAWLPSFRIDHFPFLCKLSAVGTILFEITFIFIVFFPRLRVAAAAGGIVFHNMANQFMRISFFSLQESYVALFEWANIFHFIGRRLYRRPMWFLYDGSCRGCRRAVASLRVWDIFGSVTYLDGCDKNEALSSAGLSWLTKDDLRANVQAVVGSKRWEGFAAYRALAHRIPVFWPVVPLLYLWPVRVAGARLYRHIADSRTCSLTEQRRWEPGCENHSLQLASIGVLGTIVVAATFFCGVTKTVSGWPFACYPTFSSPPTAELTKLRLFAGMPNGHLLSVKFRGITYHRLYWMLLRVLSTQDNTVREEQLRNLWVLAVRNDPTLQTASSAVFYKDIDWAAPDLWQRNPKDRQAIYALDLTGCTELPSGSAARETCGRSISYSALTQISQKGPR
jgi:predicted DCC family thiol-disulfide oxidoreductase YuxK